MEHPAMTSRAPVRDEAMARAALTRMPVSNA
jgi:hypothetical protein